MNSQYAPGVRVEIRDAEWRINRVDPSSFGGKALTVTGLSEIVKDKEAIFLTELENVEIVNPAETKFVRDESPQYRDSFLYLESLLRQSPPTDNNIYVGHQAAMDLLSYQMEPAIQALKQPRQRIMIGDAVGLGKTLEAGILVSELIKRGKGRRILTLTMKSMLTQFQKEFWTRFTIPLVRLDSTGIQRIRRNIPANHNPFYYYDKAIISIDTLKQDTQYRNYIENAYWDIIIIDEAHNVAHRGDHKSMRARLAEMLAERSDTLIMLSATPHDGKPESFASLMNMLNSTAIANVHDYQKEDIKGLFIRRFKKDIEDQVQEQFQDREIHKITVDASDAEDRAFESLANLEFTKLDEGRGAGQLFRTTLEKAFLSSPKACLQTLDNRIKNTKKKEDPAFKDDLEELESFRDEVAQITPDRFSKYVQLKEVLNNPEKLNWDPDQPDDRLVIFTERIRTMNFLYEQLSKDLKLKKDAIEVLHGSMSDIEQQRVVEEFGNKKSPIRLLIASDVASEGINLHYQSHKLIHFDIPWSLMVFQQRNGRIDRYGQKRKPQIYYLLQESAVPKIRADQRILDLLIEKDKEAQKNIGDNSIFMGQYDEEQEEKITARGIEQQQDADAFEENFLKEGVNLLSDVMGGDQGTALEDTEQAQDYTATMPSLYVNDYSYVKEALRSLAQNEKVQYEVDDDGRLISLRLPKSLQERYKYQWPDEIRPENDELNLTDRIDRIQEEIERARESEEAWPVMDYLWEQHPVVRWLTDKSLNAFGRREAPVIEVSEGLDAGEQLFLCSGSYPNLKGQPLLHEWCAVHMDQDGRTHNIWTFDEMLDRLHLRHNQLPNRQVPIDTSAIHQNLPDALDEVRDWLDMRRNEFEEELNEKLEQRLEELEQYRDRQLRQLGLQFSDQKHLAKEQRRYKKQMDKYMEWIQDTMDIDEKPHIQVAAAFIGR